MDSTGAKSADAAPSSFSKVVETGEDCAEKVFEFCENVLKIDNPKAKIQIERAHRIGNRSAGKIRPIVAKFVLSGHKAIVKSALSGVNLNVPPYNGDFKVNDQFPPEVISRRRELIPKLIEERKKGNKATLVRDKLFVNNKFVELDSGEGCDISIISWNVLGLSSCLKDAEFLNFVSEHDLIFCSETWQRSSDKFEIENYQCITVPRPESLVIRGKGKRGHGGICLFVSDTIYDGIEILEKIPQGFL